MFLISYLIMKRTGKIERLKEIVEVLVEHGLVDFVKEIGLISFVSRTRLENQLEYQMETVDASLLRELLEDLGPTFIKLGQFLALRPDLVPLEFANELRRLYEHVSPYPAEDARKIIEKELGAPITRIFDEFYNTPLGSASIGQVHEATLKTGEEVVVKVQRPNIRDRVRADMALIKKIAQLIEKWVPESEMYHPQETVNEFKKMLEKEMNYTIEARNAQRFYEAFEEDPDIIVPKVYWEYVTRKVLVLENVQGKSIRQAIDGDYPREFKQRLATEFAQAMLRQFFIHGIFHADPSPGNVYYREDGKIAFLDFGAVGRLTTRKRGKLIDLFMAMAKGDSRKVMEVLLELSVQHGEYDPEELEWDIEDILELYKRKEDVMFKEGANEEIMMIVNKHNISLPPSFLLMERALIETEGICNALDPKFDFFTAAEPVIVEIIQDRYGPRAQLKSFFNSAKDYKKLVSKLPNKINNVLERFEERDFAVTIEHKGLKELEMRLETISNRLSYTIITAAIIIGSALVVMSGQEVLFGPYIFLVSVLMGIWLLTIIVRRGSY